MKRASALAGMVLALCGGTLCAAALDDVPPRLPREFRGVWVATVANIDWPSRKGLPVGCQQAELVALLDRAAALRLNAVILQVRPAADAIYDSRLEPWSEYLTGAPGKAPEPFYDPLDFAIREAHRRGLELHAWFNPFRARHPSAAAAAVESHLIRKRPDLARPYGKHYWLNPTHPDVQDHSIAVIIDVVRRFDVDGIHLDDYFYPYAEKGPDGKPIAFPDDDTWAAHRQSGGTLARDDWRRDAVNRFIARLYREVKAAKPWVKVGISPFGIWRPGQPPGIEGFDAYAGLYADAHLWLRQGWVDYLSPQLYWPIRQEKQSYPKLLAWWVSQNVKGRHIWPGLIPSRVTGKPGGWPASEIGEQIKTTRGQNGATGNVLFSMRTLQQNPGGVAEVLQAVYDGPALVPASPWLGRKPPARPRVELDAGTVRVQPDGSLVRLYVVRSNTAGKWAVTIHAAGDKPFVLKFSSAPERLVVTAIDRFGNESEAAAVAR